MLSCTKQRDLITSANEVPCLSGRELILMKYCGNNHGWRKRWLNFGDNSGETDLLIFQISSPGPLIIKKQAMLCNLVLLQIWTLRDFFLIVWSAFFNGTFLIWMCSFAFCYNKVNIFFVASASTFITLNVRGSNVQFTITYFSRFCAAGFFF